jgi:hypothetical protein
VVCSYRRTRSHGSARRGHWMLDCEVDALIEPMLSRKIHHRDAGFYVLFLPHRTVLSAGCDARHRSFLVLLGMTKGSVTV